MSCIRFRFHLLCFFAILFALCITGILAKNRLEIRMVSANIEYMNPDMIGSGAFVRVMRKSRKGVPTLNAFFPLLKDLPSDTNVSWHCFQKLNNAWKSTLIKGSIDLCSMLESGNQLQHMFFEFSNFPSKCPVKKGNYTIKDSYVKAELLPPILPGSEWKARSSWGVRKKQFLVYDLELKILRKDGKEPGGYEAATALAING